MEHQVDIRRYVDMARDGMSYDDIKLELLKENPDEQEFNFVMNRVDRELEKIERKKINPQAYLLPMGLFLFAGGLLVTGMTYFSGGSVYVLYWGPMLAGAVMVLAGLANRQ